MELKEKLDVIRHAINTNKYLRNSHKKERKAIDKRVFEYISSMTSDLQTDSTVSFYGHADILFSEVQFSRAFGRSKQTDAAREAEMKQLNLNISMAEEFDKLGKIEKELEELVEKAKTLAEGAERNRCKQRYSELKAEHKARDARRIELINAYNVNIKIINDELQVKVYDMIAPNRVKTPDEFKNFVKEATRKKLEYDKSQSKYNEVQSMFEQSIVAVEEVQASANEFERDIANAQQQDIGAMSITTAPASVKDEFDDLLKNITEG
jgi:tetratricopeptide (TPR) repeat protein